MAAMRIFAWCALFCAMGSSLAGVDCPCDPSNLESLKARQCSLCSEAEKQPVDSHVFFLKDINPRKPNRWLALPRAHADGPHNLHEMSRADQARLWKAAIAKAKELWGDDWGLAYNSVTVRTQCHAHIHIGKLLQGIETNNKIVVNGPAEIPLRENEGVWVHPVGGKLHVHIGEQTTETVLLR